MMSYCDIPQICKVLIMAYIFALLCVTLLSPKLVKGRGKYMEKGAWAFCVLISSMLLLIYAAEVKTAKLNYSVNSFVSRFCELPVILPLILAFLMTVFVGYIVIKERRKRQNIITRSSIKESIDKLDSGLCFAYQRGRVILANYIMTELCYSILGRGCLPDDRRKSVF